MNENPPTDVPQKRLLTSEGAMRCSADERERTAAAIGTAAGEGRLSVDEAEARLARAHDARHRHELDALVADLPVPARRGGWAAIALMAREQAAADTARLLGDGATRRVRIALVWVAALLVAVLVVLAVLHGTVDEGPGFAGGQD